MGAGAFVSALLHGSVIALAVIAWPRLMPPIELPDQIVPVDILPPSDETNIAPQVKSEEPPPLPTPQPPPPPPEPPAQSAAELAPPPPDAVEALPMPEVQPSPPVPLKPIPAPPVQRFAMAHPRTKPKPEKTKPDFDINQIAGLVDKLAKEPKPQTPPAPTKPAAAARTMAGVGAQTAMTESEIDALKAQLAKCWNVPVGAPDPAALVFRVKMFLNQDGTVASPPQLLDQGGLGDPYFRAAADSAIRAVKMCEPYKLPAEKYQAWSEVTITFDPTKMAGF